MPDRLTIAIPTFNRAGLLKKALDSALAQSARDIKILVSDNGSTDGTQTLLANYDDPRLRLVRLETTIPRNEHGTFIFSIVETEFVTILSDDDWIEPEFAEEILRIYTENPEISFAYTGCIEHYDGVELPALVGPRLEPPVDFFTALYAGKRQVSWCACVLRIDDIRSCGPQPDDRLLGDMFFWTKIGFNGPVGCVARPLAHYSVLRPGGDNESRSLPILTWGNEVRLIAQEVFARMETFDVNAATKTMLQRDMGHYTTRSLANQFIWGRISGMSRAACLVQLWPCMKFSGWTVAHFARVVAAILLPRNRLRFSIIRAVGKMAYLRSV